MYDLILIYLIDLNVSDIKYIFGKDFILGYRCPFTAMTLKLQM